MRVGTLVLLIAVFLAGCAGDFGPHFGQLNIAASHATANYDVVRGTTVVTMDGTLHGNDTGDIRIKLYVVGAACPFGPSGEPDGSLALREVDVPPLGHTPEDRSFHATVTGAVQAGSRYSAVLTVKGANTIGPFFGMCQDFVAAPSA